MVHFNFNEPIEYQPTWLEDVQINLQSLEDIAAHYSSEHNVSGINQILWAFKAIALTDLTTLASDDTHSNVQRLCQRAVYPFPRKMLAFLDDHNYNGIHTAAVCVYPSRVSDAVSTLAGIDKGKEIEVAAVATGFPSGQYNLESRLIEIRNAIDAGATEIDIVLDRNLVLTGQWKQVYDEVVAMRNVCKQVHMKAILAIGECGSLTNVYKASMVAMMAGSDFIKTSTGKESVNAVLSIGLLMIRAIQAFREKTNRKIGLKPAGGVRTLADAVAWMQLVKNTLGDDWLNGNLFRFGASGLLDDIEQKIYAYVNCAQCSSTDTDK